MNPFNLVITYRLNIFTSNDWHYITLGEYLKIVESDNNLKNISELMYDSFIYIDGGRNDDGGFDNDYVMYPQHHLPEHKEEYKKLKKQLPTVNFFGKFFPPVSDMQLNGDGNGIVVLDIDAKVLGRKNGIIEPGWEQIQDQIFKHLGSHSSVIFYYKSSSGLGYHIGYITDAMNAQQYVQVYNQLVRDLLEDCPIFRPEGVIDHSVGRYNANFFVNYSDEVFCRNPKKIYEGKYEHDSSEILKENVEINLEQKSRLDEFPYVDDFRLYLAYSKHDSGSEYFDIRDEWIRMIYALANIYPFSYYDRAEEWFNRLSSLSLKYKPEEDGEVFSRIMNSITEAKKIGIDYIINKLNGGEYLNRSIQYETEDIRGYYDDLNEADLPDIEASNFLYIDQYLKEIKESLCFDKDVIIESPPNTGKSTLFLKDVTFKRIYLVPTNILIVDLGKLAPGALIVNEGVLSSQISNVNIILSTYEGLLKILASKLVLSEYTLIVDEAHNLFTSSSPDFRFLALHRITTNLHRFKNTILLSGTWIDFPLPVSSFQLVKVRLRNPVTTYLHVITTDTPLDTLTNDVVQETNKQIILINNKTENIELEQLILKQRNNATITVMNADTKNSKEVKERLVNNILRDNEILVGTHMIVEGISFLDEDIKAIRFYRNMLPEYIAQLSFRARKSTVKPTISFYQKRQKFYLHDDSNYKKTYDKLKSDSLTKKVKDLPCEYIGNSDILIYKERVKQNNKITQVQLPILKNPSISEGLQVNNLLLGNLALSRITSALNKDLFSLLAGLRKWNFQFSFSVGDSSTIRKDFKKLRTEERLEFIRSNFNEITQCSFEELEFDKKSPIYRAWFATQFLHVEYFNTLDPQTRQDIFSNKKKFEDFAEVVSGYAILNEKRLLYQRECSSENFRNVGETILSNIKSIAGYPNKISNETLTEKYTELKISLGKIKKILKTQFDVSDAKPLKGKDNKTSRYFSMRPLQHEFITHIKEGAFIRPGETPFQ